jgi:hypothetical protein
LGILKFELMEVLEKHGFTYKGMFDGTNEKVEYELVKLKK